MRVDVPFRKLQIQGGSTSYIRMIHRLPQSCQIEGLNFDKKGVFIYIWIKKGDLSSSKGGV